MKVINILWIVLRLGVGGMMLWGGYQKFAKPIPAPTQMIEQIKKEGSASLLEQPDKLKIRNYIFGMKQTNYFWQLLGICEIVFGLMLLSQVMSFAGAVMLMPITLHIFLFHIFLEPHDVGELVQTGLLWLANVALIAKEYPRWRGLLWLPAW